MTLSVLIIEDEEKLSSLLAEYCQHEGWSAAIANRLGDARALLSAQPFDLVLLDLMLPDGSGLDFCKQLRSGSDIPIIITSARVDELDRLLGLELGADDYICKPFSPREVMARIKAQMRRRQLDRQPPATTASGGLELLESQLTCRWQGQSLSLTQVEFALLALLAAHPGHILSRRQIMARIYDDHRVVSDRTVDSHIKKLRQKLATSWPEWRFIESVYGAGYRLDILPQDDVPKDSE